MFSQVECPIFFRREISGDSPEAARSKYISFRQRIYIDYSSSAYVAYSGILNESEEKVSLCYAGQPAAVRQAPLCFLQNVLGSFSERKKDHYCLKRTGKGTD